MMLKETALLAWRVEDLAGSVPDRSSRTLDHLSQPGKSMMMDKGLTPGEEQFVNMVGCYWAEGNRQSSDIKYLRTNGESGYSYELIGKMRSFLDQGKMLDLHIGSGGKGHAVDVYGYSEMLADDGSEVTVFYICDCDFPDDRSLSGEQVMNTLVVQKKRMGIKESFSFYYQPVPEFSAYSDLIVPGGDYVFIVFDEDWHCLNDMAEANFRPYQTTPPYQR